MKPLSKADALRQRILERSGGKCEQCGVPNHSTVLRTAGWWQHGMFDFWHNPTNGAEVPTSLFLLRVGSRRQVRIVLTVAHTPGDDPDENLKALCQWCHRNYDRLHHKETRSTRKDAARPLLAEGESA